MEKYKGKSILDTVAIGEVFVIQTKSFSIKCTKVEDTAAQWQRVVRAKEEAIRQLTEVYEKALEELGEADAQIFQGQIMMIEDEVYNDAICEMIKTQKVNAEYAVAVTGDKWADIFKAGDNAYMRSRAVDVKDISNRMISCLMDDAITKRHFGGKRIVCAEDLTPSEAASLDREEVLAFVTVQGSVNSHTAILARTMNIPAIIGVESEFLDKIKNGEVAIVDGTLGEVILNPDEETMDSYLRKQQDDEEKKALLQELKGKENITLDGTKINICANIGSIDNIDDVIANDAGGIGLFRSEFLYLERYDYPTEDEQYMVYKRVLEAMEPKKVIIRTFDVGADKQAEYFELEKEENPALGVRGIRVCLERPEVFRTQLRALYRASVYGRLGILFPMITSVDEVTKILELCEQVKQELAKERISYAEDVELGIMIETPAAALISDRLAPMVDFFSIGTNDLIQYTLACDRQNPKLERFCNTHHEAIFRLIEMAAKNAHVNGAWIGICGELAADTALTKAFLKMGIDELSVSPSFVLKVREVVRRIDLREGR